MPKLLGDGVIDISVAADPKDAQIAELTRQVRVLARDLADARLEADQARENADRALSRLRQVLQPLYTGLQMVFGEFEAAGISEGGAAGAVAASGAPAIAPRIAAIWENWKQQLPGYPARVITALLLHKEMNTQQLAIACGCKSQRISEAMVKLNKAALINKNGRVFSLKPLG